MHVLAAAAVLSAAHSGRSTSPAVTIPIGCVGIAAGLFFLLANRRVGDTVWHTGFYRGPQNRLTNPGANGRYAMVTLAGTWFIAIGAAFDASHWL